MATLTPTPVTLPGSITIPADGENIDAADVNGPLQHIADGVACFSNVVADLTALAAVLTPSNGALRHVRGLGLYEFRTSATTGLSPFRVAAGDATAGGWVASHAYETTRTVYVPGSRTIGMTATALTPTITTFFNPIVAADGTFGSGGSFAVGRASTHAADAWGFVIPIDEWLVDGATLASATLRWTPDFAGTPAVYPQMSVVRTTRSALGITATGMLAAGFLIDSGGTYDPGTDRDFVYTPDQNNVIDRSTYSYAAIVFDEHGVGATSGNTFHSLALSLTGIPDGRR